MKNYIITVEVVDLWNGHEETIIERRQIYVYNRTIDELNALVQGAMDGIVSDYASDSDIPLDEYKEVLPLKIGDLFVMFAREYFTESYETRFFIKVEEA